MSTDNPLAVLASFALEVMMGAYRAEELPDKAKVALSSVGLMSIEDVVSLAGAAEGDPPRDGFPSLYGITGHVLDINTLLVPRLRVREMETVMAEAYQVVGVLLDDTGQFGSPHGDKVLDNLSEMRQVHADVLPWESASVTPPATPA